MNYTKEAIKKALESNWVPVGQHFSRLSLAYRLQAAMKVKFKERFWLDPSFWQALGKSEGWNDAKTYADEVRDGVGYVYLDGPGEFEVWRSFWHHFIDHLAEGKDPESFFQSLLTNKKENE